MSRAPDGLICFAYKYQLPSHKSICEINNNSAAKVNTCFKYCNCSWRNWKLGESTLREDIFARRYLREKISSREDIFANRGSLSCEFRRRYFRESRIESQFRRRYFREIRIEDQFREKYFRKNIFRENIFSGKYLPSEISSDSFLSIYEFYRILMVHGIS